METGYEFGLDKSKKSFVGASIKVLYEHYEALPDFTFILTNLFERSPLAWNGKGSLSSEAGVSALSLIGMIALSEAAFLTEVAKQLDQWRVRYFLTGG